MSTSPDITDLRPDPVPVPASAERQSDSWLWAGVAAGLLGLVATIGVVMPTPEADLYRQGSQAVLDEMDGRMPLQLAAGASFLSALLLVPFLRGLVARLRRARPSAAPHADLVSRGGDALVASLLVTVSLRYIGVGGMPGGVDADYYTATDSTALAMLASQMQFAGWLPGLLVTGVLAHGAFRAGLLPRWAGAVLGALTALSAGATLALGLPYSAGVVVPGCVLVVCASLLLGRRGRGAGAR